MTHIVKPVLEAVRGVLINALPTGHDARIWLYRVPGGISAGYPRITLDAVQSEAEGRSTFDRVGIEVDVEVALFAKEAATVLDLEGTVTDALVQRKNAPNPSGAAFLHLAMLDTAEIVEPRSDVSDVFGRVVRVRYHYRAN